MSKSTRNSGKPITKSDIAQVRELAKGNTPTRVIGFKIGRTPNSVYKIASDNNISLEPPNQSPYNRRKKS